MVSFLDEGIYQVLYHSIKIVVRGGKNVNDTTRTVDDIWSNNDRILDIIRIWLAIVRMIDIRYWH